MSLRWHGDFDGTSVEGLDKWRLMARRVVVTLIFWVSIPVKRVGKLFFFLLNLQGVQKILLMHVHFRMQCELFRTRKRLTANLDIRTWCLRNDLSKRNRISIALALCHPNHAFWCYGPIFWFWKKSTQWGKEIPFASSLNGVNFPNFKLTKSQASMGSRQAIYACQL